MKFKTGTIEEPMDTQGWEAAIDVQQDGEWHDRAVCCYGVTRANAIALRDEVSDRLVGWERVTDE